MYYHLFNLYSFLFYLFIIELIDIISLIFLGFLKVGTSWKWEILSDSFESKNFIQVSFINLLLT